MTQESTILLDKKIIEMLKKAKDSPRQTYNELLRRMLSIYIGLKERNQYDEFLHKIQKEKMKELWNNKEDEDWEKA